MGTKKKKKMSFNWNLCFFFKKRMISKIGRDVANTRNMPRKGAAMVSRRGMRWRGYRRRQNGVLEGRKESQIKLTSALSKLSFLSHILGEFSKLF